MDFESPDVEKDFPGLYASEHGKKNQDSDYSDDEGKLSKKDLLIGKRKDKRDSKKDKGYMAFEGESSDEATDDTKSPSKSKKTKTPFKFPGKDKKDKGSKLKESKKQEEESKKESKKKSKKEGSISSRGRLGKLKRKKDKEEEKPLFGVPLQLACDRSKCHDGIELPAFIRECIDYIEEHGLGCEGIYRISGVKSKVQQLRAKYNQGERVYLYEHEPHTVASLLKQFLRDLPENILTPELKPKFEEAASLKEEGRKAESLKKLLLVLPTCNRLLLSWVFVHMLHVIEMERRNKMSAQNVTIMLGPTMQISHQVLQAFFLHKDILFQDILIKKYVAPLRPETSRQSLELPDTPAAIEEELGQQESFLNQLHAELNTGLRDKHKEEQLWEVQRVVTQLKRKLRFLRQQTSGKPLSESSTCGEPATNNLNEDSGIDLRLRRQTSPAALNTDLVRGSSRIVSSGSPVATMDPVPNKEPTPKPVDENDMVEQIENEESTNSAASSLSAKVETTIISSQQNSATIPFPEPCESSSSKKSSPKEAIQQEPTINSDSHEAVIDKQFENTVHAGQNLNDIPEPCQTAEEEVDLELRALVVEERMLHLQHDELEALSRELKRKLVAEKMEICRLRGDIAECQQIFKYKQYSFDSSENSSESGSSESQDEDEVEEEQEDGDLQKVLQELIRENQDLEVKNADLSQQIHLEREACMLIKVQIKFLQESQRPTRQ